MHGLTMQRTRVRHMMVLTILALSFLATVLIAQSQEGNGQGTGVFAEAITEANLRANTGIEYEVVGQITSGTRYPVIGRSEFFPWLLLGDPTTFEPFGWVFSDIVTIYGNVATVPLSTLDLNDVVPTSTIMPTSTIGSPSTSGDAAQPTFTPSAPTFTPTPAFTVYGTFNAEVNLRYGPGTDFERVGVANAGESYQIVGYHTQFPWLQIAFEGAPDGVAWVFRDLLDITGDVTSTRPITQTDFSNLPTLTPTQAVLSGSSVTRGTPVPVSDEFLALGNQLWNMVLEAGFDPVTSRFGALYLKDLQTGEEITFGNDYAFSGTSIMKIPIMVELFELLNESPDPRMAIDIANTMICSENVATNRLLNAVGNGNDYAGAEQVTLFLNRMGLQRSFLTAPYDILGATPAPPPAPVRYPETDADQEKANPNLTNQMTVDEMGYLLSSVYQCGINESGPLMEDFSGFTPQECRKMMHVMVNNNVDALLKAGVPASVPVAHKHGWVDDTHGNAAIMFTPGGDYVLVMMLHQPTWLVFEQSLPVIAEVSRTVYNYYNPDQPLEAIRDGYIPLTEECNFAGSELASDLISPYYAEILPFDPLPYPTQPR